MVWYGVVMWCGLVWCGGGGGGSDDGGGGRNSMSNTDMSNTVCPPRDAVFVAVRDLAFEPGLRDAVNRPVTIFETAGNVDEDFPVDFSANVDVDFLWRCRFPLETL
jgi:hypothetical protein